ncbi:MAG: hypothetical protein KC503_16460 [Myxococcales bacterium]|nr:hypothetical protein [Myxococcales bacterium]
MHVHNEHERVLPAPPEAVRPWIERLWTGGEQDAFPRDRFVTWRHEQGDETTLGHATLRFRLRRWDGSRWEAEVLSRQFEGWHGFDVERCGDGTRIRHTLEGDARGAMRWRWSLAIRGMHDWAVESLFDRLQEAVATGEVPDASARPMGATVGLTYALVDTLSGGALSGAPKWLPFNWGATAAEMRSPMPCDALLRPPHQQRLFRAIDVRAPRSLLFRWLCQMRVAPYSYDWIDNYGRRSPRELTPGLEQLAEGQQVMRIFRLAAFEHDRHLTLVLDDARAQRLFGELAICYRLDDTRDPHATRLFAKIVARYPRGAAGWSMRRLLPWGDLVMMRKQLLTFKALAERDARRA